MGKSNVSDLGLLLNCVRGEMDEYIRIYNRCNNSPYYVMGATINSFLEQQRYKLTLIIKIACGATVAIWEGGEK